MIDKILGVIIRFDIAICLNIVYTNIEGVIRMKTNSIKKWGNGTGILIPKAILESLSLKVNDKIDISIQNGNIVLSPVRKKKLTLAERFQDYEGETTQKEFWEDNPVGKEML